jgi:type VI secretion system protein ImpH
MASAGGKSDAALIAELTDEPWRFSFFVAVQLLQRVTPNTVSVGELGPARREALRFVHDPNLIFHSADITAISPRVLRDGVPFAEITTTFLGLYGAVSPLAAYISENVIGAERADEHSLKAFYDIFHHRLLSLLYRAWKKYRFQAGFRVDGTDPFTRRALSFVGVDAAAMPREGLSALQLLALASLLSIRTRPARSLQIILERLFPDATITLENFIARRVVLKDDQIAKLGTQSSTLGVDLCVGGAVVDRTGRFRVGIGPVNYALFEGLLPGGQHHPLLRKVINQFSRGVLEIECEITLAIPETPQFQLGAARGAQLGVMTRLRPAEGRPMRARFVMGDDPVQARPILVDADA